MSLPEKSTASCEGCIPPVEDRRTFLKIMAGGIAVGMGSWIVSPIYADAALSSSGQANQTTQLLAGWDEYNKLFKHKIRRCIEVGFTITISGSSMATMKRF